MPGVEVQCGGVDEGELGGCQELYLNASFQFRPRAFQFRAQLPEIEINFECDPFLMKASVQKA